MKFLKLSTLVVFSFAFSLVHQSCTSEAKAVPKPIVESIGAKTLTWNKVEEIEAVVKADNKPVIMDLYTDWCGWCKVMDKQTFANADVIKFLNQNFHMVKFNAEQKTPVKYRNQQYDFVKSGRKGYNQLATELLQGRMSYPSFVVLDANLKPLKIIKGFKPVEAFISELQPLSSTSTLGD